MKKLIAKDIKKTFSFSKHEKTAYVLHSISLNSNIQQFIRKNAVKKLQFITKKNSISILKSRCKMTINKKRFCKMSNYSRHVFLKLIRFGKINGFQKACW